jgi:serine/threonine protein kinase
LLDKSLSNYNILKSLKGDTALHFQKYIPVSASLNGGKLSFKMDKRAVPLSGLELPQEHVNWILSRALEFTAWLHSVGYVHCGITPESVFVIPENHGIQICSFYHMKPIGSRVTTISAKYKNWYPPNLFSSKEATPNVDIELCKKTAICLLGDKSGSGIKLKKTHNEKFMDFVIAQHYDSYDTFSQYRKLLKDNFEKKFYSLNL